MNSDKFINALKTTWTNSADPSQAYERAKLRADMFDCYSNSIPAFMNSNTIPASLKRAAILQTVIHDFARRLLPLRAIASAFQNVPLEGTNKVEVPYYDLDTSDSTSFDPTQGYVAGNTVTAAREIEIGRGATNGDRLYQALGFTSEEVARQPFLKLVELARVKAEKLASDVLAHVFSIVTEANFGDAAITQPAAMFDSDDVADLKLACKLWPEIGRSLVLDSEYDANLLKDPGIKAALNYGGSEAIREGRIPKVSGFNYFETPTIPDNGENLKGFAVFQSAILFATAPVPPTEEVRNAGTRYEIIIDPVTEIAFEYRAFGNSQKDTGTHVIECNYGFAKGNGNALKRIVSA